MLHLLVLALLTAPAPQDAEPGPASEVTTDGPVDPEVRASYEELAAWIDGMSDLREIEDVDFELERLQELVEGPDAYWVGRLAMTLAESLEDRMAGLELRARAYERARAAFLKAGDVADAPKRATWALQNHAAKLQELGLTEEALAELDQLRSEYLALGDERGLAEFEFNTANALYFDRHVALAIERIRAPIAFFRRTGDFENLAAALNSLATFCIKGSRFSAGLAACEEQVAVSLKHGLPDFLGRAYMNRGSALQLIGRLEDALAEFELAESVFRENGDVISLAKVLASKGMSLNDLRRFDESADAYERALQVVGRDIAPYSWVDIRFGLADLHAETGQLELARSEYAELLEWARASGDHDVVSDTLQNLAGLEADAGNGEQALEHLAVVRRLRVQLGDLLGLAEVAEGIGNLRLVLGEPAAALEEFATAGALFSKLLRTQFLPMGDSSSLSMRHQFRATLTGAMQSLHQLEPRSSEDIGRAYRVLQTFHGASMYALLAEQRTDLVASVPAHLRKDYERLIQELEQASYDRQAAGLAQVGKLLAPADAVAVEAAASLLVPFEARIVELERDLSRIEERMRAANPVYASVQYPTPASIHTVQARLPAGAALIEYAWTDAAVFAFVITAETVDFRRLADSGEAAELVHAALAAIANGERDALDAVGRKLVSPVLPADVELVLIAPDGELCFLPFEAALIAEGQEYLVESHEVAYVHSGTVLSETPRAESLSARTGLRLVALGDPRRELGAGFEPLPGTAIEALELAYLLSDDDSHRAGLIEVLGPLREDPGALPTEPLEGGGTLVRLGVCATESSLGTDPAVRDAEILFLGCHGLANLEEPALSRLYLAPGAGSDGDLSIRELANLELTARMVVLSACESNLGALRSFEGLTGFALAARQAGARSVLSTLWKVRDEDALALMRTFFHRAVRAGETPCRALSAAKRQAISEHRPVRSWAGYLLWDTGS